MPVHYEPRLCEVKDCRRVHYARGRCRRHYRKLQFQREYYRQYMRKYMRAYRALP